MRHAMVMAGGSGTRLWPLSTKGEPKQLAPLIDGRSLLRIAFERVNGLIGVDQRWVCAGAAHEDAIFRAVPELRRDRFLGEPMGRDTVNAVALTAAVIEKIDPGGSFCVLTADPLIEPRETFLSCLETGFALVEENESRLVTFSIEPTFPATGYGYIERGEPIAGSSNSFAVSRYVEKPALEAAKEYLATGRYGWNSGMFVWRASGVLDALERFKPESAEGARRAAKSWGSDAFGDALAEIYPALPKISVDFALMEPASTSEGFDVCTVNMDVSWRDVGSWSSLAELTEADGQGNRVRGHGYTLTECNDVFVFNADASHHVAMLGCEGLTIVHTKEATLVMPSAMAERLKDLHAELPESIR